MRVTWGGVWSVLYNPGRFVLSAIQQTVLTNLYYFYLRVPSCRALGGVQAAAADGGAVLLFSGGYTRADAGQVSEAGSYWQVADALQWFGHDDVKLRAVLEVRTPPLADRRVRRSRRDCSICHPGNSPEKS